MVHLLLIAAAVAFYFALGVQSGIAMAALILLALGLLGLWLFLRFRQLFPNHGEEVQITPLTPEELRVLHARREALGNARAAAQAAAPAPARSVVPPAPAPRVPPEPAPPMAAVPSPSVPLPPPDAPGIPNVVQPARPLPPVTRLPPRGE